MNTQRLVRIVCLISTMALVLFGSGQQAALASANGASGPLATMQIELDRITWQPHVAYESLVLTIATPDGDVLTRAFASGQVPSLTLDDLSALPSTAGQYTYELKLVPALDAEAQATLAAAAGDSEARARAAQELRTAGKLPDVAVMAGTFAVQGGQFAVPDAGEGEPGGPPSFVTALAPNDIVHADDVIITGSMCVGFDCLTDGTENFGFDTVKLKENNLRLFFDDTSTIAGFPANDWRITANDSASGGASYFSIEDATAARVPFRIEAGARSNSLYVDDYGHIGFGTSTPVLRLHLVASDTPGLRLEQDGTAGWTPQTWDVAGNESNFFIRDVTNGSKLPFRIQPNAPSSSLTLMADGRIGMGTWSPAYAVELERTGEDAVLAAERTDGATARLSAGLDSVQIGSVTPHTLELVVGDTPVMTLTGQGNMTLVGALSEYSDVNAKKDLVPVDGQDVLDRLAAVPVMTWSYNMDEANVRHMGPMAQDFYAAFGLGPDNRHIAPLDESGVSLAAIQALARISEEQDARIAQLEDENAALEARLAALEELVNALAAQECR